MKLKSWLPWVCFLFSLAALGAVYLSDQKKEVQLVQLSADNQELHKSLAAAEESQKAAKQNQSEELISLRKDNEDLLRLRNEVHQLRDEKAQLAKQTQNAQAQAQTAQTQAQAARAQAQQAAAQAAQAQQAAQAAQLAAAQRIAGQSAGTAVEKANACINSLRQIDGAKQQWALENAKTADAIPTLKDIAPYLGRGTNSALPVCPAGGNYTINAVSAVPTCNIPGHALPQQ